MSFASALSRIIGKEMKRALNSDKPEEILAHAGAQLAGNLVIIMVAGAAGQDEVLKRACKKTIAFILEEAATKNEEFKKHLSGTRH